MPDVHYSICIFQWALGRRLKFKLQASNTLFQCRGGGAVCRSRSGTALVAAATCSSHPRGATASRTHSGNQAVFRKYFSCFYLSEVNLLVLSNAESLFLRRCGWVLDRRDEDFAVAICRLGRLNDAPTRRLLRPHDEFDFYLRESHGVFAADRFGMAF